MSAAPLRSVGLCLIVVTLVLNLICTEVRSAPNAVDVHADSASEKVKRGAGGSFQVTQIGYETNPQREAMLFFDAGDVRINTEIILNHPNFEDIILDESATTSYIAQAIIIQMENGSTISDISTFSIVDGGLFYRGLDDADVVMGAGVLFLQRPRALLVQSTQVLDGIFQIINSGLPTFLDVPFAEIILAQRLTPNQNIYLNVDSAVRDGFPNPADDVIELVGSSTVVITDEQELLYNGNDLVAFSTSVLQPEPIVFSDNIASLFVIESVGVPGTNVRGLSFEIFNTSNLPQQPLSGPGILRLGQNRGQDVAFYSRDGGVNQQITEQLVGQSLLFSGSNGSATVTALYPPSLMNQQLFSFAGAQRFILPTATSVRILGTTVNVFEEDVIIQRFDLGQPPVFSSFIGHQVQRSSSDQTFNIPDGGATLWVNAMTNTFFLYPSRNPVINAGIAEAMEDADIDVGVTRTAEFALRADEFGVVTLTLTTNDNPRQTFEIDVHPAMTVFDVPSGWTVSYKGQTVEFFDADGNRRRFFDMISPLVVNQRGAEIATSSDTFFSSFGGGGRLYIDDRSRAFYTTNPSTQTFISNFIDILPQPVVNLVRERGTNNIYFRAGNDDLLLLNGGTSVTNDRTAVYNGDSIAFVNTYDIPNNARARYDSVRRVVEVLNPNNPSMALFRSDPIPLSGSLFEFDDSSSFPGDDPVVGDLGTVTSYDFPFNNGIIYHSGTGALVSSSNFINNDIGAHIGNIDGVVEAIPNVFNLTVADGRSIVTYTGSAPFLLRGGGTYYISRRPQSDGIYFDTASYMTFLSGVTSSYAQLNPATVFYNITAGGELSLRTSEGQVISSFLVGETTLTTLDSGISIRYFNETIFFEDGTRLTGINEFVYWDGFQVRTFDRSVEVSETFFGPGLYWLLGDGRVFFTNDAISVRRVQQLASSVESTFRQPTLIADQRTFRSKFSMVAGGFPQNITIYEGADVRLRCNVSSSNPRATINFFQVFLNESGDEIELPLAIEDSGLDFSIVRSVNYSDLIVRDLRLVADASSILMYRCRAMNFIGSDVLTTTVNILPSVAPAIVENFIPPLEFFTRTSDRLETTRAPDPDTGNNMLSINRRFFTITGPRSSVVMADDGTTIVRRIHIGCKAEGLPKSEITWLQLVDSPVTDLQSDLAEFVNESMPGISITVPREGRSVLSVVLDQVGPTCTRYICRAENVGGVVYGGTDICTQNYDCEGPIQGECSSTCGFGIAPQLYSSCALTRGGGLPMLTVNYTEVPRGLFPLGPTFCERDPCPVLTYAYGNVNQSNCSVTCGCGVITSDVVCLATVTIDGVFNRTDIVNNSFCAYQSRPSNQELCFNPPCPFYAVSEFGVCSKTCRGYGDEMDLTRAIRTRNVTCMRAEFNMTSPTFEHLNNSEGEVEFEEVEESICEGEGLSRPNEIETCNNHIDCPFRYNVGPWGLCNAVYPNCEVRELLCENFDPRDYRWAGNFTNVSVCEHLDLPRPHILRHCGGGVCRPGVWRIQTNLSTCSVTCGRGLQRVTVVCVNSTNQRFAIDEDFCSTTQRPSDIQQCAINCKGGCFTEPPYCGIIKMIGCNLDKFKTQAENCCMSCPKQATPITNPITEQVLETAEP